MSNTYTPPQISVVADLDSGEHVLYATSHSHTAIAGERIFRAEPWPEIAFSHASQESAERDAQTLREYLEECASGKRKDKEPAGRGWWMD